MRDSRHTATARTTATTFGPAIGRRRHVLTVGAAAALALTMSACGAITAKITEEGAERIIESETGEDIELDIGGDGISVQTEDGSFSLNEDGEFVLTDADGSVFRGSADDDSLVVLDEDGDPVLNVDSGGDGDTGEITIQGDDGEAIYRVVTDIPDEWPGDIPRPDGLTVEAGSFGQAEGETLITLVGTPNGSAIDFTNAYGAALVGAGFEETGRFDSEADGTVTAQRTFETAQWILNINGFIDDGTNMVNMSVFSSDG